MFKKHYKFLLKKYSDNDLYSQSLSLSKKKGRTEEEDKLLYTNIDILVEKVKQNKDENSKEVLTALFYPFIIRTSTGMYYKYLKKYENRSSFNEVVQMSFEIMIDLIKIFDRNKSSFIYFIQTRLPFHLFKKIRKEYLYFKEHPILITGNGTLDKNVSGRNDIFHQVETKTILETIHKYIKVKSQVPAQKDSTTLKKICDDFWYMLDKDIIQKIAKERGITYHSVYEVLVKIKLEIANLVNDKFFPESSVIFNHKGNWSINKTADYSPGYCISYRKCLKCYKMRIFSERITSRADHCKCGSFEYIEEIRYTDFGRNRFPY